MKTIPSKSRMKSVLAAAIIMMLFASLYAVASDQTVSIDGLKNNDVITAALQSAIDAAEGNGTVTVTGTGTISLISGSGYSVEINIPADVTVAWKANLSGSSFSSSLLKVNNAAGGVFEVATGGVLIGSNSDRAIEMDGNLVISGGTVSGGITLSGESATAIISGGTVSGGTAIQATGQNSLITVCGNGKVSGTNAIRSAGNVEVKDNAEVSLTSANYTAILITEAGKTVTVSGGKVDTPNGRAISNAEGTVIVGGGTVNADIQAISAKTVIVGNNGKVLTGQKGGTSYTGAAIIATDVEIKDDAEVSAGTTMAISANTVMVSGGTVTTAAAGNSTHDAIETTGSTTVSGGTVTARGTAIFSPRGANSLITVCGNGKVEGGSYGDAIRSLSGNIEIKENAEVGTIYSNGSNITVSGGTVTGYFAISSHYSSSTSVTVSGGAISATSNGYAIDVPGNVTVNGGTVSATSGTAISGNDVTVAGGTVSATSGKAIRGTNVTVTGGRITATSGYAIDARSSSSKIIVSGGLVFAYIPVILVNNDDNFTGVSSTGVVIGWNQAAGNTSYAQGSINDLSMLPAGCAKWDSAAGKNGIAYENGNNKGFIPLEEITITDMSGITAPQTQSLQIYPNPATTALHIKPVTRETVKYTIYDNKGQTVMQGKLQDESTINIQSLPNGIYYLKITDKADAAMKFIKR